METAEELEKHQIVCYTEPFFENGCKILISTLKNFL